jgi:hypothetical protein
MAKFYGKVGYGQAVEGNPGVYSDDITERQYYGDVVRNSLRIQEGQNLNDDLTVGHSISILADAYANQHYSAIRYVELDGTKWKVVNIEMLRPRLVLRLGGVYNGPTT